MKVMLGQINTTPRDWDGNYKQIVKGCEVAANGGADMAVFPEAAIPGYLSQDLMYTQGYIEANKWNLSALVEATKKFQNLHVVVGYFDYNTSGNGKPFRNKLAVIKNGGILTTYSKQLLPFYDVFDEGRYFEPGTENCVLTIDGQRWGFLICEDVWNDKGQDNYNYDNNPLQRLRDIGVDNIISINSSPWVDGKVGQRLEMLKKATTDRSTGVSRNGTIVYVNQVGGQDELVFDGHSAVIKDGEVSYVSPGWKASADIIDVGESADFSQVSTAHSTSNHAHGVTARYRAVTLGIKDYIRKSGFTDVVVSSSGGIDSAAVIALAAEALGPKHVHAIRQPGVYSSEHSVEDAIELHKRLGVHDYEVKIDHMPWLEHINESLKTTWEREKDQEGSPGIIGRYYKVADENIQARMRGQVAMHFSNAHGALLLTTGNKTEMALGYATLYGDMSGGYAPLIDLYKLEVYDLCRYINTITPDSPIPYNIINKRASAELAPDQFDEDSLLPYEILDPIVKAYIEHYIDGWEGFKRWWNKTHGLTIRKNSPLTPWLENDDNIKEYRRMINLIDLVEFKRRQATIGPKLSRVAFGTGRRIPIIKKRQVV